LIGEIQAFFARHHAGAALTNMRATLIAVIIILRAIGCLQQSGSFEVIENLAACGTGEKGVTAGGFE